VIPRTPWCSGSQVDASSQQHKENLNSVKSLTVGEFLLENSTGQFVLQNPTKKGPALKKSPALKKIAREA